MRRTTYTLYNILILACVMLTAGGGTAWGQNGSVILENGIEPAHTINDILYVIPGESTLVRFQKDDEDLGMDGYIRWYVQGEDGNVSVDGLNERSNSDRSDVYSNGIAYYNSNPTGANNTHADEAASIWCQFDEKQITQGIYLIYEASSVGASREGQNLKPKAIGIRHVYKVENAFDRATMLNTKRNKLQSLGISNRNLQPLREADDISDYVLNTYDIYMPAATDGKTVSTNFRLPENLTNYYVPTNPATIDAAIENATQATRVRWTINTFDGEKWTLLSYQYGMNNIPYILQQTFTSSVKNVCILAEVGYESSNTSVSNWYPVSFLNVSLKENTGAMTEEKLKSYENDYTYIHRFEDKMLDNKSLYERIAHISFEKEGEVLSAANINELEDLVKENYLMNNFTKEPFVAEDKDGKEMEIESYYAFAHPELYAQRGNRLKVMKGEYGLYRTLNYGDISRAGQSANDRNNVHVGEDGAGYYDDYFPRIPYNVQLTDRLWEKTADEEVKKSGYFMYVDASEFPGVISKIPISGLCPNTSLIVNAWVCEVSRNSSTQDRVPANIGFTLKAVNGDNETILAKYYSGALTPEPSGTNSTGNAKWQQVSFKFSFSETEIGKADKFILEISSNCEGSRGADFGIDEISVYKTLPAITAQRKDACESSVLTISTDYQTLQSNMMWDIDSYVIDEDELDDPQYRKYRYGLMGDDPYAPVDEVLHSNVGNVYFAFTEKDDLTKWISLNKDLEKYPELTNLGLQYTMRVAVQTDMNKAGTEVMIWPDQDKALKDEIIMNVRAMNDFLADVARGNWPNEDQEHVNKLEEAIKNLCNRDKSEHVTDGYTAWKITEVYDDILTDPAKYAIYEEAVRELYACLEIPRIRCPWRSEDYTMLYLSEIDVHNTDLRFAGEIYKETNDDGEEIVDPITAKGEYYVVLFSARQIAESSDPLITLDLTSDCALKKPIYVMPSTTIAVETQTDDNLIACAGTIQSVNANLQVAEVDAVGNIISPDLKPFEEVFGTEEKDVYTFDWFLGAQEEFKTICTELSITDITLEGLQGIIKKLRGGLVESKQFDAFNVDDVEKSTDLEDNEKKLLKRLLGDGGTDLMLTSGKGKINFRFVKTVYAMPYIPDLPITGEPDSEDKYWSFCAEGDFITLTENDNVPTLNVGIPTVNYPPDFELNRVPLRLGLENITSGTELTIPIQRDIEFGAVVDEGVTQVLKALPNNKAVHLNISGLPEVGSLEGLYAENGSDKNQLTLKFYSNSASNFKEGETYSLSIPFGEYTKGTEGSPDQFIESSCEGTANLVIKIVPEYLTWQGDANAVWYNDDNWNQSTKAELYMDDKQDTDANGDDDVTDAFTPLYFTKITIPDGEVLNLKNEKDLQLEKEDNRLNLGETTTIQYDMAVNNTGDNNAIKVVPYYGNKVDQIYFKPNAKPMNQQELDYGKAWVEFEIGNTEKRWMASPLQQVYAGDMYAPTGTLKGRQETEAFKDIEYKPTADTTYSRWVPAFYQKSWSKEIEYFPTNPTNGKEGAEQVAAVQSNWSIEYNDVRVPYKIGKGFYLSVEDVPDNRTALVRLPKADTEYTYETKSSLRSGEGLTRTNSGKLVDLRDGPYSLNLSDDVDGDGTHFLVGNPFMTYLDMGKFLAEDGPNNDVLELKYWTLANGAPNAIVGTPDVDFGGESGTAGSTLGTVEPMQAFFVELKNGATPKEITFTPAMMSATAIPASGTTTKSYSATSPAQTITAERGEVKSVATLRASDKADNGYNAAEDAIVLLDSELDAPMAYSVAGSKAAQVNAVKSIRNIGLGVYNDKNDEVTLTIEGLSRLPETLYLYDAHTRKSVKLEGDSYSLQVSGDSHGRYFLRDSELGTELENTISIYSAQRGKVIVSSLRPVKDIKVVTLNGSQVRRFSVNTTQYTFNLPAGIYMIYASDGEREHTEKVVVR